LSKFFNAFLEIAGYTFIHQGKQQDTLGHESVKMESKQEVRKGKK